MRQNGSGMFKEDGESLSSAAEAARVPLFLLSEAAASKCYDENASESAAKSNVRQPCSKSL